jgi:hypothetical protein
MKKNNVSPHYPEVIFDDEKIFNFESSEWVKKKKPL